MTDLYALQIEWDEEARLSRQLAWLRQRMPGQPAQASAVLYLLLTLILLIASKLP